MHRIVNYFKENRKINIFLILVYFVSVVVLHGEVGALINGSFDSISRDSYNYIILAMTLIGIVFIASQLYRKFKVHPYKSLLTKLLVYSLGSIIIRFSLLFVINIEAIHFVQYAILALLLYPLTESATATMVVGTIAGALDELYQYLILDTRAMYYDFNDVFLDSVGLGLGLFCMAVMGIAFVRRRGLRYKRAEWVLPLVMILVLIIMGVMGEFHVMLDPNAPASFTLFKEAPQGFWHYPGGPYARFHICLKIGLLLSRPNSFLP